MAPSAADVESPVFALPIQAFPAKPSVIQASVLHGAGDLRTVRETYTSLSGDCT